MLPATWGHVMSRSVLLLPRVLSDSVALLKLGSVLTAMACVTTGAHGRVGPVHLGTGELVLTLA